MQAGTEAAAALLCHRHSERIAYRLYAKPAPTDFGVTTNGHTQPWSAVYGLHLRSACNYTDYYSFTDPEGMEG